MKCTIAGGHTVVIRIRDRCKSLNSPNFFPMFFSLAVVIFCSDQGVYGFRFWLGWKINVMIVLKPTNFVLTQCQTHQEISRKRFFKWYEKIYAKPNFLLIIRGLGWSWIVTLDGFCTIIKIFSYWTPAKQSWYLVVRKHRTRVPP